MADDFDLVPAESNEDFELVPSKTSFVEKVTKPIKDAFSSLIEQPPIEKRTPLEAGSSIFKDFLSNISPNMLRDNQPKSLIPTTARMTQDVLQGFNPSLAAIIPVAQETLRREEAIFGNTFRSLIEKKPLKEIGQSALRGFSGTELSTLGNGFEELGMNDFSSASAGLLASMALPSNLISGGLMKVSSPERKVFKSSFLTRPKGVKGVLSEVFSKTTGLPRESMETAITEKPSQLFAEKYNEVIPRNVSSKIVTGINDLVSKSGQEVESVKNQLKMNNTLLNKPRIQNQIDTILNKFGFSEGRQFSSVSNLGDDFQSLKTLRDEILKGDLTVDKALNLRQEIGNATYSGFTRGGEKLLTKASQPAESVLRGWRNAITKELHSLSPELANVDKQFVINSQLKEQAAKFFDTVDAGEKFLTSLEKESITTGQKKLLRQIVMRVSGSDEWLQRVRYNLARKGFDEILPKGIIQRAMGATLLGFGSAAGGPVGMTSAIAAILTSPRAVKFLLQAGERGQEVLARAKNVLESASARSTLQNFTQ